MREELIEQRRLSPTDRNWDLYTCYDAILKPARMEISEFEETVLEMWESVYTSSANRQRMRYMVDQMAASGGDDESSARHSAGKARW
jgi:hypothetical protein